MVSTQLGSSKVQWDCHRIQNEIATSPDWILLLLHYKTPHMIQDKMQYQAWGICLCKQFVWAPNICGDLQPLLQQAGLGVAASCDVTSFSKPGELLLSAGVNGLPCKWAKYLNCQTPNTGLSVPVEMIHSGFFCVFSSHLNFLSHFHSTTWVLLPQDPSERTEPWHNAVDFYWEDNWRALMEGGVKYTRASVISEYYWWGKKRKI